ncbi:hypothetical protein LXL04_036474 [Taraxacum kok-saghyz]
MDQNVPTTDHHNKDLHLRFVPPPISSDSWEKPDEFLAGRVLENIRLLLFRLYFRAGRIHHRWMDRSHWMYKLNRSDDGYLTRLAGFLKAAEGNRVEKGRKLHMVSLCRLQKLSKVGNEMPISTYQAKKLLCPMGMEVERIHACPNYCMIYRNQYADLHNCITCGTSQYKRKTTITENSSTIKNGPPAKVLWYLPIIPRLKRLFANPKDAKLLRWHAEERKIDGKIRHVAVSPQWRNIDSKFQELGEEIRNIRFGLSSDGFNPFGSLSSRHSTWPVLMCIYNLPPSLCMKRRYIMMSLLIQGPKQPGNDIDVY